MTYKVLLVEDDEPLAHWIIDYLAHHQFEVNHVANGDQVIDKVTNSKPDLVVLDLMLPGLSGFEICQQLRKFYSSPILMLTASNEDEDEIRALELGATDFVSKPVRPKVLLARLHALLRRGETEQTLHSMIQFGQLTLDHAGRNVTLGQTNLALSAAEFDLLWILASHAGEVVSRDTLLRGRRGLAYDGLDRSIDIAISRLRKKLGDLQAPPEKIKTIRAKGYLFVAHAWD